MGFVNVRRVVARLGCRNVPQFLFRLIVNGFKYWVTLPFPLPPFCPSPFSPREEKRLESCRANAKRSHAKTTAWVCFSGSQDPRPDEPRLLVREQLLKNLLLKFYPPILWPSRWSTYTVISPLITTWDGGDCHGGGGGSWCDKIMAVSQPYPFHVQVRVIKI